MAENETSGTAVEDAEAFEYPIKVEDAGPATKKVSIEIPRERIEAKLKEQFKELRQQGEDLHAGQRFGSLVIVNPFER